MPDADQILVAIEGFIAENEKCKQAKRRIPWAERRKKIIETFPSVTELRWEDEGVLVEEGHPEEATMVMAEIMRSMIQVDQILPGRRGGRPPPDFDEAKQTWRELMRRDFAAAPFEVVFQSLSFKDSIRSIANKTGIAKSKIDRLRRGLEKPDAEDMRLIAKAYGRNPAIFLEYRQEFVLAAVMYQLDREPELVTALYAKIMGFQ